MIFFQTIAVAFSMFSGIPMPQFLWNEKNMRYMMLAFPLVGIVVGAFETLLLFLADRLHYSGLLLWVLVILIPIMVTGGIHLDGFCDTCDALGSHAGPDKKLEILKDSHVGAFALIGLSSFLLFGVGAASLWQFRLSLLTAVFLLPVISRTLSGLAVVFFPCAKKSGLLHTFQDASARKTTGAGLAVLLAVCLALVFFSDFLCGIGFLVVSLVAFIGYYRFSKHVFGGITGDLAGFFVSVCEIFLMTVISVLSVL